MEESLTRVLRYVSPTTHRKFKSLRPCEDSDGNPTSRRIFEEEVKNPLGSWFVDNCLFSLDRPFPGEISSHRGYAFIGEEGSVHITRLEYRELKWNEKPEEFRGSSDEFYYYQLTVKSQPRDSALPKALEDKLKELKYQQVEEFKPYR